MPLLLAHSVLVGKVMLWTSLVMFLYGALWVIVLKWRLRFKSLLVGVLCYCIPPGLVLAVACSSKRGFWCVVMSVVGAFGVWWSAENLDPDGKPDLVYAAPRTKKDEKDDKAEKYINMANLRRLWPRTEEDLRQQATREGIAEAQKRKALVKAQLAANDGTPAAPAVGSAPAAPGKTAPTAASGEVLPGTPAAKPAAAKSKGPATKSPPSKETKEPAPKEKKKSVAKGASEIAER